MKRALLFATSLVLLAYTTYRAAILSFTWDEAFTFLEFVRKNTWWPTSYDTMSANNHLLNTWLMNSSHALFGDQEWALRLPNVIAHALYLFFSAKLVMKLKNQWWSIAAFVLLNVNPFLLDFFSLARGYGLSIGLLMGSMYFFYQLIQSKKISDAVWLFVLLGTALLSNLTLMSFVIAVALWVLMVLLSEVFMGGTLAAGQGKKVLFLFIPLLLLLGILVPYSFQLKAAGALFYGGNSSLWKDTINELVRCSLYDIGYPSWLQSGLSIGMVLLLALSIVHLVRRFFSRGGDVEAIQFHHALADALLFVTLSSLILNYFFDVKLLTGRTALFLFPLFALLFVFLVDQLLANKKIMKALAGLLLLANIGHASQSLNLSSVLDWKFNADVKTMLQDIQSPSSKSIGMEYTYEPVINYYRATTPYLEVNKATENEIYSPFHDYYYLSADRAQPLLKQGKEPFRYYPVSNSYLFKNEVDFLDMLMQHSNENEQVLTSSMEYSHSVEWVIQDTLEQGFVRASSQIEVEGDLYDVYLVISLESPSGNKWYGVSLADFQQKSETTVEAHLKTILPEQTQSTKMKTYIWNKQKRKDIALKRLSLELYVPVPLDHHSSL